ncbi:MAG: DUF3035 domain-containing protein [Alphaproteobacteria bacterium]
MRKATLFCLMGLPLTLAACGGGGVKEGLGLTKTTPDEFAVVKRAPLEMPPSYTLRPPQPGAPRPQEQATAQQARQTVFGPVAPATEQTASESSSGESALLGQAGGQHADPSIRQKVDQETAELHDRNKPVVEKLLGIGGNRKETSATVVNAAEEAKRLQQNAEEGKTVIDGETPSIEE